MNLAAIDLGSQSIRMSVFAFSGGNLERTHSEFDATALGKQGFQEAHLGAGQIAELVALFERYAGIFEQHKVVVYAAVATSAMRHLSNKLDVVEAIRASTGIEVQIIDGAEEAELSYQGVLDVIGTCSEPRWLVDIGGGSVEIIAETPQGKVGDWSLPLGSWRFPELCADEALANPQTVIDEVQQKIRGDLSACGAAKMPTKSAVVALGGNVRAIGWILSKEHGSLVDKPPMLPLNALILESAAFTLNQRAIHYEISESRAETLTSTATILYTIASQFGAQEVVTPHVNLRRGMAAFLCAYIEGRGRLFSHPLKTKLGRRWKDA